MAQKIERITVTMTFKEYKAKMRKIEEELCKYYVEYLCESGQDKETSQKDAKAIVEHGAQLKSNDDDSDVPCLCGEKVLMLAFPGEGEQHRRREENESYIEEYLGNKDDPRVTYEEIHQYSSLCGCICNQGQSLESDSEKRVDNAGVPSTENKAEDAVIHKFLRTECQKTHTAHVVFSGHGKQGAGGDHKGGALCMPNGNNIDNQKIIDDMFRCFSNSPADEPPHLLDIVFAQCGAKRDHLDWEKESVEVTCLAKSAEALKKVKTFSLVFEPNSASKRKSYNANLQEHAKRRK